MGGWKISDLMIVDMRPTEAGLFVGMLPRHFSPSAATLNVPPTKLPLAVGGTNGSIFFLAGAIFKYVDFTRSIYLFRLRLTTKFKRGR